MNNTNTQRTKKRLQSCVLTNILLLIFIVSIVSYFSESSTNKYLRYGPQHELNIMGVEINTWHKYIFLQIFLMMIEITNVWINEIASPILGFNIYNPDKREITEFGRCELQIYANMMWLINSLRSTLMVLITISQIDIAVTRVLYGEITTIYTIRMLLNEKTFPEDNRYNPIEQTENTLEMV